MTLATVRLAATALFPLPDLAAFCAPGVALYRSFDHVIAAKSGAILLAPVGKVGGDLRQLRDGCPVPWKEVWEVIDTPTPSGQWLPPAELIALAPRLALAFSPYGWTKDLLRFSPHGLVAIRLCHENGLRFAFVPGC